ncbi:MAG: FAD-binding oxidoreductase [Gammaproteobacteria bacterium]|nr:FAD-binding oxidoreductase [Gammaproteobacteria bacterium]
MTDVFSRMKPAPYWWDAAPRVDEELSELPADVDALIVGSGFSGISAARILARAGKSVLVCDADVIGFGASTRNGGMLGPSFHKLGVKGLKAHYGEERTYGILKESVGFVDFIRALVEEEDIACDFRQVGRFRGASRPSHYEVMARELEAQVEATGIEADLVPRERVRDEIGTDRFYGGIRYMIDGGLHPGKYHDGLVRVARSAGAIVTGHTEVTQIEHAGNGFRVATSRGVVDAGQVAICTNAYTGKVTPWFRRRVLPIRSSIIATAELEPELMNRLMPTRRCYGDSRRLMAYYRPSPDGQRILFGGRATSADKPLDNARKLRISMLDLFPELADTAITHSWSGLVAYAFDHVPHLGEHDGLWYALGYCGSGVARATFFGTKLGHKMLGNTEAGKTAFDDLPLKTRPLYTGNPWFMSPIIQWHRMLDRFGI